MKSKSSTFSILSVLLFVAVVLYFMVEIVNFVRDPITTTVAYKDTVDETITIKGYIVRDEEVFTSTGNALSHEQEEGAKVGVGQVLATCYNSKTALDILEEIDSQYLKLEQLDFALSSFMDQDAALRLDGTIIDKIEAINLETSDGEYSVANSDVSALKVAVMKREFSFTTQEEIESDAAQVKSEIASLEKSLGQATYITAQKSGIYSSTCDGYESVLTTDILDEISPEQLRTVSPVKNSGETIVGKLIYGDTWYFAAICDTETAESLKNMQTVNIRFAKGLREEIKMTVDHLSAKEDGKQVVVLKTDKYIQETTLMRNQEADIVVKSYEGIRIPSKAIRVNEEGETGVYCQIGMNAKFKPVTIVYRDDEYALVTPNTTSEGTILLRAGDQVVISNEELYDGKVIGE